MGMFTACGIIPFSERTAGVSLSPIAPLKASVSLSFTALCGGGGLNSVMSIIEFRAHSPRVPGENGKRKNAACHYGSRRKTS